MQYDSSIGCEYVGPTGSAAVSDATAGLSFTCHRQQQPNAGSVLQQQSATTHVSSQQGQQGSCCVTQHAAAAVMTTLLLLLQVETDGGRLVIGVMREGQLPRCADLLADTFVDTKGIQAYRWAKK